MEDNSILGNLKRKWGYIEKFDFIYQAFLQQTDMLIIGGPGSGKSLFVNELTKIEDIECVAVKVKFPHCPPGINLTSKIDQLSGMQYSQEDHTAILRYFQDRSKLLEIFGEFLRPALALAPRRRKRILSHDNEHHQQ